MYYNILKEYKMETIAIMLALAPVAWVISEYSPIGEYFKKQFAPAVEEEGGDV